TIYKFASDVFADQSIEIGIMQKMLESVEAKRGIREFLPGSEWSLDMKLVSMALAVFLLTILTVGSLKSRSMMAQQANPPAAPQQEPAQPAAAGGQTARGGERPQPPPPPPAVMPPPVTPIVSMAAPSPDPRVGLSAGRWDAGQAAWNMRMISTTPPSDASAGATHSDLAFMGKYVVQGNYNGFEIWDISNPEKPVLANAFMCPASQNDVSVFRNLLFMSSEATNSRQD